jgi:hypothetical protein
VHSEDSPTFSAAWTDSGVEVVELGLLLPAGLAAALEEAARGRGLTVGQVVRRLVQDFIDRPPGVRPDPRGETA